MSDKDNIRQLGIDTMREAVSKQLSTDTKNSTNDTLVQAIIDRVFEINNLTINIHQYSYSSADGGSYNYGTITTLNGNELPCRNNDIESVIRQLLEHLGYNVEITLTEDHD
jgi:hypothetical protein